MIAACTVAIGRANLNLVLQQLLHSTSMGVLTGPVQCTMAAIAA